MTDHYKNTIINRYKNSGISSEAQIITHELLAKAKKINTNHCTTASSIKSYKISTLVQIV